jgi:hypothetical protein
MSGIEALAILGGVAASIQLLQNATNTFQRIVDGSKHLSVESSEVELRFLLLADLQKLNDNLRAPRSEALEKAMEGVSRELHELQDFVSFEESLKRGTKRDRARHAIKQPARTKKMLECVLSLDTRLELIYKTVLTRCFSRTVSTSESSPTGQLAATKVVTGTTPHAEVSKSTLFTQRSRLELTKF